MICPLLLLADAAMPADSYEKFYRDSGGLNWDCRDTCGWWDKENKRCAILSIAKSLDRLHNSQIKPSIKGD